MSNKIFNELEGLKTEFNEHTINTILDHPNESVTTDKIADGAINTNKIADGVLPTKLLNGTIRYYDKSFGSFVNYTANNGVIVGDLTNRQHNSSNEPVSGNVAFHSTGLAFGQASTAIGQWALAGGYQGYSNGRCATSLGCGTTANAFNTVIGQYNIFPEAGEWVVDSQKIKTTTGDAFVIGNGVGSTTLSNAFKIQYDGTVWSQGDIYVGSTSGTNLDGGSYQLIDSTTGKIPKERLPENTEIITYIGNGNAARNITFPDRGVVPKLIELSACNGRGIILNCLPSLTRARSQTGAGTSVWIDYNITQTTLNITDSSNADNWNMSDTTYILKIYY